MMSDDLFLLLVTFAILGGIVTLLSCVEWLYYKVFGAPLSDESEETKR